MISLAVIEGSRSRDWSNCLQCWWLWCCHGKAQDFRRVCVLLGEVPSCCDLLQSYEWAVQNSILCSNSKGRIALIRQRYSTEYSHYALFQLESDKQTQHFGSLWIWSFNFRGKTSQLFALTPTKRQNKNASALHIKIPCKEWCALK